MGKLFYSDVSYSGVKIEPVSYGVILISPYLGKVHAEVSRSFLEGNGPELTREADTKRLEKWAYEKGFTIVPTWSPEPEWSEEKMVWDNLNKRFVPVMEE